jgi:hypothetical protein
LRVLEIITIKEWRNILERFEELWQEGYFQKRSWKDLVYAQKLENPKFKRQWLRQARLIFEHYDHWLVTHVPPEYIVSYKIIDQKGEKK